MKPQSPTIAQVEAARLRVICDRRLGRPTPGWVKRVAEGLPAQ